MYRWSRLALTALFIALAVAVGYGGSVLPNVELVSITVFLGGVATGAPSGILIGVAAELLFSGVNPLGPALPLVLAAQLLGMGLFGLAGGVLGRRMLRLSTISRATALAFTGLILTLCFDVITNLALGVHLGPVWATLAGGLAFAVVHIVSNMLVFAVLGGGGLRVIRDLGLGDRGEEGRGR